MSRCLTIAILGCLLGVAPTARAVDEAAPRVVAAWAAGPFETRIAFDRAVEPALAKATVGKTILFDESRPNRRSTVSKASTPSDRTGTLHIAAARIDNAGRTLVLTTDPHPRAGTYQVELPLVPVVPVSYDLGGVDVSWYAAGKDENPLQTDWWPAFSPDPARPANVPAEAIGGSVSLQTLVSLPRGPITLTIAAPVAVEATLSGEGPASAAKGGGSTVFSVESTGEPMLLSLRMPVGPGDRPTTPRVTFRAGNGPESVVNADHLSLPWTPASPPTPGPIENVPDLKTGDPAKGKTVFLSMEAKCANCHKVRGEGGNVGPDLSSLVGHDRTAVYRDIAEPSARIHPDFVPYTVALKDGRIMVGSVRAEGADAIRLADTEAKVTVVPRAEIEDFRPGATSVMPVGLVGVLGEERLRDLIAFLTSRP